MKLEDLVTDYLAHQRGKGLSPRTVDLNRFALHTFIRWAHRHKITDASELDKRVMDRYAAYLLTEHFVQKPTGQVPLSRESARTYSRSLSTFLTWCQAEEELSSKVTARQPKAIKRLREVLTLEEIDQLENACELERDKLMVRLLAQTGIRLGEMLNLKSSDVVEVGRERFIRVTGKTGPRMVPVPPALFVRLRRYAGRGDRVFMTVRKSPKTGEYEPLRPRSVQNMVAYAAAKAGIDRIKVTPHGFRHALVTQWLRQHKNPVSLQHILGWSSLAMLQGYEHLDQSDTYAAMLDFSQGK